MSQKKAQLFNPLNGNINVTGVVTAASFVGSGSGLTGVASTDNIQTATDATFLANVNVTGVTTAAAGFKGDLTGDVTGDVTGNATGLSGTPNITVGSVAASSGTVSGNLSIGGTLTYQDVSNVDSVGLITARKGIQVLADGANITGVSTFQDKVHLLDNDRLHFGGASGDSGDLEIYHNGSTISYIDSKSTQLRIETDAIRLRTDGGETYLEGDANASVKIYYNNSKKFETTPNGAVVTGILTATSFSGDASALSGISSWEVFDTWLYGGG